MYEDSICIKKIGAGSFANVYLFEQDIMLSSIFNTTSNSYFIIKEIDISKLINKYTKRVPYRTSKVPCKININKKIKSISVTPPVNNITDNEEELYYNKKLKELINSEINILNELNHDNIIKFYSSNCCNDIYSIKMEYCNLGDLYNILKGNNPDIEFQKNIYYLKKYRNKLGGFNDQFIKMFLKDTLNGLLYLEELNIIHRDIKLQNILGHINQNNIIFKITDFGFACYDNTLQQGKPDKKYYKLCGTPYYMAPEIILNIDKLDQLINFNEPSLKKEHKNIYNKKIDIWGLGICLYELIFNSLFNNVTNLNELSNFFADTDSDYIIKNKINQKTNLSPILKELILKMIVLNPFNRSTIHELYDFYNDNCNNIFIILDNQQELIESWEIIGISETNFMNTSMDQTFKTWLNE